MKTMDIHSFLVGPLASIFYIPSFLTSPEQAYFLHQVSYASLGHMIIADCSSLLEISFLSLFWGSRCSRSSLPISISPFNRSLGRNAEKFSLIYADYRSPGALFPLQDVIKSAELGLLSGSVSSVASSGAVETLLLLIFNKEWPPSLLSEYRI